MIPSLLALLAAAQKTRQIRCKQVSKFPKMHVLNLSAWQVPAPQRTTPAVPRSHKSFRRRPCCFCPGGAPIGVQTYSMQLPAKNDVPPEVWFAAAIFESVVYPYHARGDGGGGDGGGGGGGGSVRVEEMER